MAIYPDPKTQETAALSAKALEAFIRDRESQDPPCKLRSLAPNVLYRMLRMHGLSSMESANLVAYLNGLPVDQQDRHGNRIDWNIHEIQGLLFMRTLAQKNTFDH